MCYVIDVVNNNDTKLTAYAKLIHPHGPKRIYISFFFNDTATPEIYTLSLHDALPISSTTASCAGSVPRRAPSTWRRRDRKSTRLNSSHGSMSYAVFCLKKKNKKE